MRNPETWTRKPLGQVATLQRGFDLPIQHRRSGFIPVYGSNGIDGWHSKEMVRGPGVITGRSGSIGFVFHEGGDYWPLNTTLYVRDFHGNDTRWVARLLESLDLKQFAASTGVPSLNRNFVHPVIVSVPPVDEQRRIADILDAADSAIRQTEAVMAQLRQMKAGLLHDLLTRGLDEQGHLRDPQRHPEQFKDSPLGRIPTDWEVGLLSTLVNPATQITYGIVQAGPHVEDGVPYIRTGDMAGDELALDGLLRTSRTIAASFKRSEVRTGDIVCAIRATVGKVLPVPPELDGANLTQGTARISPRKEMNGTFLLWALRSHRIQRQFSSAVKGTTFVEITLGQLRDLLVAFPRVRAEQDKISNALETDDHRIRSETKVLSKLKFQKQGLMHDLLIGRVRV